MILAHRLLKNDVVVILNVVRTTQEPHELIRSSEDYRFRTGQSIIQELAEVGSANGVRTLPMLRTGAEPDEVILEVAASTGAGLIVMGTDIRPASDRLFLGPRV